MVRLLAGIGLAWRVRREHRYVLSYHRDSEGEGHWYLECDGVFVERFSRFKLAAQDAQGIAEARRALLGWTDRQGQLQGWLDYRGETPCVLAPGA